MHAKYCGQFVNPSLLTFPLGDMLGCIKGYNQTANCFHHRHYSKQVQSIQRTNAFLFSEFNADGESHFTTENIGKISF